MRSTDAPNAADAVAAEHDLGPLAWVLDELRKSLEGAVKALRRFVRDSEQARGSDIGAVDVAPLRIARQQLHQASGALEMVGMAEPAPLLRAMEAAVQRCAQHPELCSEAAASTIERAGFALSEYLEALLAGKPASAVGLFPQYREVQALAGSERVHPADLFPVERRTTEPETAGLPQATGYGSAVRARMDHLVLRIVKRGDAPAAQELTALCLGLAASLVDRPQRIFWKLCGGFFEAVAAGLVPADIYVKRVASRVLLQYTAFARGEAQVPDRLLQDLLFFNTQARPADGQDVPALRAVRNAYAMDRHQPIDYETRRFGRFDPALLAQARKRIAAAAETWSALAGGDRNKLKATTDQFSLVADSLRKLHPESAALARSLTQTVEHTVRAGEPPSAAVAMEVATAVLYLQAAYEELDVDGGQLAQRAERLAQRLDRVRADGDPEPLESWMEDLYRRVSDRQTMGSVVEELRSNLADIEKSLDNYFRQPTDTAPLVAVPSQLSQMRGVLSVLGLDQASHAVMRMRDSVERLLVGDGGGDEARGPLFEKLGNSLGALGFLIDMLSYQRQLARKLFVYDEELGELKLLMGRQRARVGDPDEVASAHVDSRLLEDILAAPPAALVAAEVPATLQALTLPDATQATQATQTAPAPSAAAGDDEADELRDIFLDEAREVVFNGVLSVDALGADPADLTHQTTLRRAFHTLKGSSRMVGFNEFGEAAWAMEQMLNGWLAEQKQAELPLRQVAGEALNAFGQWVEDIASGDASAWTAKPFRAAADALRLEGRVETLAVPHGALAAAPAQAVRSVPELDDDAAWQQRPFEATEIQQGLPDDLLPEPLEAQEISFEEFSQATQSLDFSAVGAAPLAGPNAATCIAPDDDASAAVFDEATTEDALPVTGSAPLVPTMDDRPQPAGLDESPFAFDLSDVPAEVPADSGAAAPVEPAFDPGFALADADRDSGSDTASEPEAGTGARDAIEPVPAIATDVDAADLLLPVDGDDTASAARESVEPETVAVTDAPLPDLLPESDPEPATARLVGAGEAADTDEPLDESVRVIGTLRIGIPLYNVYLNEADEWSRRLETELNEWALELHQPLADSPVALAHSLAGSSATVGFHALSGLARTLEGALQHVQLHGHGTAAQARVFVEAAEDIRRLLHQFAAGFLKEPDPRVADALREVLDSDVGSTLSPLMHDLAADAEPDAIEPAPAAPPAMESETPAAQPEYGSKVPETPASSAQIAIEGIALQPLSATLPAGPRNIDDDIDVVDTIDPDLFPIFEEEAIELLPQLGGALRQWVARPDNERARGEVLRVLHTLKGSARLAGAMRLGELAHRLESSIEQLDSHTPPAARIEPLLADFDGLQSTLDRLRQVSAQTPDSHPAAAMVDVPAAAGDASQTTVPAASDAAAPAAPRALPMPTVAPLAPLRQATNQSVRVRAQLLDRLVNQAGEVMISRSRLESRIAQFRGSLGDLSGNLDRLRQQLRDIEVQAESQMQSRLAQSKDSAAGFDPLEFDRFTRVQELTRMMAESVNDVATVQRSLQRTMEGTEDELIAQGRQARELQRDLLRTRMVEFEGISERLYAVVRQASKETGKQIKLDITGGSIEMDRGVLDRMTPAFEHLLRNAVAHGIEHPEVRTAAGKPPAGTITVGLSQAGNDVSVEFRDDGAGLQLGRIREKALAQGLVAADAEMSDDDAAQLIFQAGFTTAEQVTGLAGRGIGMDVVRAEVNALGGRIETQTETGQGTRFRMVLPLTTAVTQVVMLRAGNLTIGVPANVIEIVRRVSAADLERSYLAKQFDTGTEAVPFFWAGALLQATAGSGESIGRTRPVIIFRSAQQRLAVHVDEVLGNQEVVVKNLGPQLARLPGLAGMSVLASGAVVLIYNPVALATVYGEQVHAALDARHAADAAGQTGDRATAPAGSGVLHALAATAPQVPLILVVDDSITVRRVTQRLLQREGYRVALASDGLQALERLQEEKPAMVLSDIEMPRMDGFDLVRNIRADAALADLPVVMITSRIAGKHREHALELGVDHYLGKPYSEEVLLSLVRGYTTQTQPAPAV